MQLDSYLEIFTTMYGWAFANIFGEIITGTGLVVLPFMLIVFNAWREASEQGVQGVGVFGIIDRIGTQLIVALFVFSVCFATLPVTSLASVDLSYKPQPTAADPTPATVSRDTGTGSTFDSAMVDAIDGSMSGTSGSLSQVPAWWFTVMSISSGANAALRAGITNSESQIRAVEELARIAAIEDPALLQSMQRFYSECFVPAQSRYINTVKTDLSAPGRAIIDATNRNYGPNDVGWMGSKLFRTEDGFYPDMRAANPVPGFIINFARDGDYYDPASGVAPPYEGYTNPDWGRPTCQEWWESGTGVREAMIQQSDNWRAIAAKMQILGSTSDPDLSKDKVAKLAQSLANPAFVDTTRALGFDASIPQNVGGAVSTIGVFLTQLFSFVTINPLLNGLLMMQAIILMGIYMFLPLITFLSGYSLKVMLYGAVGIFTVKFWAVLWGFTVWLDGHLVNAMYPAGTFMLTDPIRSAGNDYKLTLMAMLMMTMFIGLPALWTVMMSWIGIRIGTTLDSMVGATSKTAEGAANRSVGRK
jgi:hypothetical protein